MGTRGLTCVVQDGEYKVAQYGQWDHYPDGQGATILNFLHTMDRKKFEARLKDCHFVDQETILQLYADAGHDGGQFVNMGVSDKFKAINPQLNRDMGGGILAFIQDSEGVVNLQNEVEFALDGLMCEFVYVVDLDNNMFEVYEGFNIAPVEQDARFQGDTGDSEYSPVALVKSFPLDDLPDAETFISAFKTEEVLIEELEDRTRAVLNTLRQRDIDTETANHIANYIEANMDDFVESVCAEE